VGKSLDFLRAWQFVSEQIVISRARARNEPWHTVLVPANLVAGSEREWFRTLPAPWVVELVGVYLVVMEGP